MSPELATSAWHAATAPLADPIVRRALLETSLIGASAGAIGCWVILYGLSYSAESLSHSLLPGLVVATLVAAPLTLGAVGGALAAAIAIAAARRVPVVERDTAVAVVVTALFGAGVLLALSPASPPGIADLLFGNVLGTSDRDLAVAAATGAGVGAVLWALHHRLLVGGFDPGAARSVGVRPGAAELAVVMLSALVVVAAVQSLGSLLVVAVVIGPAMTARQLTARVWPMMAAAAAVAAAGGAVGLYASYYLGSAAGASIVIAYLLLFLLAAGWRRLTAGRWRARAPRLALGSGR
jgi:ABC-type Mn2+/Zn2+ transport system permease subunit